jgi:hypothetical protein
MEWVRSTAVVVLAYPVNLVQVQVKFPTPKVFDQGHAVDEIS